MTAFADRFEEAKRALDREEPPLFDDAADLPSVFQLHPAPIVAIKDVDPEGWAALTNRPRLRFRTPVELCAGVSEEPDWIVRGLVARGAITEIDGKIKAAGKTTLTLAMVRCILDGEPFLDMPTQPVQVVYVTEQSAETFSYALRVAGLEDRADRILILTRKDIGNMPWPEVVVEVGRLGYPVNVFDTIGKLARIVNENDAGEWSRAMNPLMDLSADGRAVIIPRHDRKGGGEVGESGRGSSQASGDVDIILGLRRPEGHQSGTRRVIQTLSRFRETPEIMAIEWTGEGYVYRGEDDAVSLAIGREFVSAHLAGGFGRNELGPTMSDLIAAGKAAEPPVSRSTIQRAIEELLATNRARVTGAGVKGDPKRYEPVSEREMLSAQTLSMGSGGKPNSMTLTEEMESIFKGDAA